MLFVSMASSNARDGDALHLDRLDRVVVPGPHLRDLRAHIHPRDDFAEDGVLGCPRREPIEIAIVSNVDEELGSARVWPSCIGHGESAGCIGVTRDVLVLDVATIGT